MNDVADLLRETLEANKIQQERLETIERILDRQGLAELKPGTLVDKEFCDVEHGKLTDHVCGRASGLEKSVNRKIYSSWSVLILIGGIIAKVLFDHEHQIVELGKQLARLIK